MNSESKHFALATWTSFLAGAAFFIWFLRSRDVDLMPTSDLWVPVGFLFVVTFVCASLMPRTPIIVWPITVMGVVIGVGVNAFTDGQDHNLFPIEMVFWAGLTAPSCLSGALLGSVIYWFKKRRHNQQVQPIAGKPGSG